MTQTLEQLSAAATELLPCPFCSGPAEVESKRCGWRVHCIKPSCYTAGPYPDDCTEAEAITRWNQRTGQLVAVSDDAMVERVARALAEVDGIQICSDAIYALSSYGHRATAAIAAMKDTQLALAAKGTGDE